MFQFKLTFYEVEPDPDQPYHMKLEGDPVDSELFYGRTHLPLHLLNKGDDL